MGLPETLAEVETIGLLIFVINFLQKSSFVILNPIVLSSEIKFSDIFLGLSYIMVVGFSENFII